MNTASSIKNSSEAFLAQLGKRSFLSLWSYPNVYRRDRPKPKEVCDLLVIFDNHVVVFSIKNYEFGNSVDTNLGWDRWYKKAVKKSAQQIWGAERHIKTDPNNLFLDANCTQLLPVNVAIPESAIFHRVLVAYGASERCKAELGGSGSLMIRTDLIGDMHFTSQGGMPFALGQVNPSKGFIHIFDNITLELVMSNLDTISDFVSYLEKKCAFLTQTGKHFFIAGEEDLLGLYLSNMNSDGSYEFKLPEVGIENFNFISLEQGFWQQISLHPSRIERLENDRVSYYWDEIIELVAHHAWENTEYYSTDPGPSNAAHVLSFMAREDRLHRRILAKTLLDLQAKADASQMLARRVGPLKEGDPLYIFLILPQNMEVFSDEEHYRIDRRHYLQSYLLVQKLEFPHIQHFVGLAFNAPSDKRLTVDVMHIEADTWDEDEQAEVRKIQNEMNIGTNFAMYNFEEEKYSGSLKMNKFSGEHRNMPCPCRSGKKYKNCCLKKSRQASENPFR